MKRSICSLLLAASMAAGIAWGSKPATPPPLAPVAVRTTSDGATTTLLPDGRVVIDNRKVTLRHADGRVEERRVRIVARPSGRAVRISALGAAVKNGSHGGSRGD